MLLYDIWRQDSSEIREKRVDQIIGFAGDGKLGDNNTAPVEFRSFLERIPTKTIARYADECLTQGFGQSGFALQDIVNEMGRRLGFTVEHGRYRGTKNDIGYDGVWFGPDGHAIVLEVKTTDAYRLPVETVANYRRALIKQNRIKEDESSILIVVGREDTGEIEAQIRGSRHAWDVRLISVDALARLMRIRQEVDDPSTENRIRSLLVPREYTRVDEIIDLAFSAAEEFLEETPPDSEVSSGDADQSITSRDTPVSFNRACAERISRHLSAELTKQSRIVFADTDKDVVVSCAVSKEYADAKGVGYWFAIHPYQLDKLKKARLGYAAFGCGSPTQIALFPIAFLEPLLDGMNQTHLSEEKFYWHIQIHKEGGNWFLRRRKGHTPSDITANMLLT